MLRPAEAVGFGDGPLHDLMPFLATGLNRALRCPARAADLHPDHAADAGAFHGFMVLGEALATDVAIDPEPEDPGSGRWWKRGNR